MKTTSLLFGTFLILLTGGCMSDGYGPASPDYYPEYSMGFRAMPKPLPAPAKATAARALPALDRVVFHATAGEALPAGHPARAKIVAGIKPQAFVCIGETCSLPVGDPAGLVRTLAAVRHN